ncbi:UpxY family transcription antiterminator [Prevotella sp. MGM1]|uniref:UpxY family transcription antiterminator n=1 Tax=Prevotella sp. MGM1 TaxID=2033405 RepID=UPI000CE9CB3C|nr:UpxY family transcription antiterminator [Prevotella sp. MGM1]GAY27262.1 KOW motif-containing protein [Prevotella sp. MGM1]
MYYTYIDTIVDNGDPLFLSHEIGAKQWYPMRVTYNRELKVKRHLDALGIENFLPMRYDIVIQGGNRKRLLVPAVHNLIFVRTNRYYLTYLKYNDAVLEPLRYIMQKGIMNNSKDVMIVPERQMDNFIRVCRMMDNERVQYLKYDPYLDKPGQRVRIIDGNFAGVEGVIKRINKNKQVVVIIPGIVAVTLSSIPYTWIEKI